MGLAFLIRAALRVHAGGFNTSDGAFPTIFFCLHGLHSSHVFVGLAILAFMTIRAWRWALLGRAPSRRRDRRDLLALRRRDVDRRVHDGLHPLTSG
jgi:heme/copper-type cytochrome/quinol oxidase subunit 3